MAAATTSSAVRVRLGPEVHKHGVAKGVVRVSPFFVVPSRSPSRLFVSVVPRDGSAHGLTFSLHERKAGMVVDSFPCVASECAHGSVLESAALVGKELFVCALAVEDGRRDKAALDAAGGEVTLVLGHTRPGEGLAAVAALDALRALWQALGCAPWEAFFDPQRFAAPDHPAARVDHNLRVFAGNYLFIVGATGVLSLLGWEFVSSTVVALVACLVGVRAASSLGYHGNDRALFVAVLALGVLAVAQWLARWLGLLGVVLHALFRMRDPGARVALGAVDLARRLGLT